MFEGTAVNQGSLSDGFSLTLYKDTLHLQLVTPADSMALGATLYIKAFWTESISGIKFYVDKCNYSCGTMATNTIDIIKVSIGIAKVLFFEICWIVFSQIIFPNTI